VNLSPELSGEDHLFTILALVVPDDSYSFDTPLVVGTNAINEYYLSHKQLVNSTFVSDMWKMAFLSLDETDDDSILGKVKSTRVETIPPGYRKTIRGICHSKARRVGKGCLAFLESIPEHALPGGLLVTSGTVSVSNLTVSTFRVSVELQNHSLRNLTLPAKRSLCNLHRVSIVDNVNSSVTNECDGKTTADTFLQMFDLPEGEDGQMVAEHLCRRKGVFSLHDMDFGHTNAVTHDINISDETPVKLRHRRIPPATYADVRHHIQEMTNCERRYSQTEREALGLVWACERFHSYVYGMEFDLVTDHKPLEAIYTPKSKP